MDKNKIISVLKTLTDLWEKDENMYSSTMDVEVDKEFMQAVYGAIVLLKQTNNIGKHGDLIDKQKFIEGLEMMGFYIAINDLFSKSDYETTCRFISNFPVVVKGNEI